LSDEEFVAWLRSMPRERSPEQVDQVERQHDAERGEYIPHGFITHHYGEAQH
jgi:hypothetical protein